MQVNNRKSNWGKSVNFTVLVPVHKSALFESLLPPAIKAAKKYKGKVLLLNIIEKPYLVSHQKAEEKRPARKALLSQGIDILQGAECKGNMEIVISPDVSRAIKNVAQSNDVNLIVLGSNKKQRAIFSNEIPYKLQQLDCSIIMERETVRSQFKKVFVFADRLPKVQRMLEHASFLASSNEPALHVLHDFRASSLNEELDTLLEQIETYKTNNPSFSGEITHSRFGEIAGDPINIPAKDKKNSCVLIRYKGNWFEQLITIHKNDPDVIAQSTGLPIYVYKLQTY